MASQYLRIRACGSAGWFERFVWSPGFAGGDLTTGSPIPA